MRVTNARPLSREERDLLRARVDQARREAQRLGSVRSPTELQRNTVDEIAAFLASHPGRLFSMSEIGQALHYNLARVKRALAVLETQERAMTVKGGRFLRWKAFPGPGLN